MTPSSEAPWQALLLAAALALAAAPAAAQYKIVNPDGSVTYTDRPPPPAPNQRVSQMGRAASAAEPEAPLPPELRQAMQRYPVVIYTSNECSPCQTGRQLLLARGIPFNERKVLSDEDSQAFERQFASRMLPLLTIGNQALKGFQESDWTSYLDAAGYPKQSRLPRSWQPPPATPLVERTVQAQPVARATPAAPAPSPSPALQEPPPGGVRF